MLKCCASQQPHQTHPLARPIREGLTDILMGKSIEFPQQSTLNSNIPSREYLYYPSQIHQFVGYEGVLKKYYFREIDYALISKSDLDVVKQIYWRKTEYGYARGKNPITRKDIFLHKYITQTSKETVIDHINRNKLDCRRENMRIADSQINSLNRNAPRNSTTGYKGVTFDYRTGKFRAYVKIDRKQINLGLFDTAELAYQERLNFEQSLMGIVTMKCKGV